MDIGRPAHAIDPLAFGRRGAAPASTIVAERASTLSDDLRLFALTYATGFLFVFVFLI